MITQTVQRWRDRRDSYRPIGETIDPRRYEVALIPDDTTAKGFVLAHHYSGSYPAARHRYGLYRGEGLVGVAVFSQPMQDAVLRPLPGSPRDSVELGRFVLDEDVPANGETWFLARAFELLRGEGVVGVVSFSDPEPRDDAKGQITFLGHIGTIYQAFNATYLGRGTPRTLRLLPDGTTLSDRTMSKIRRRDRGWRYSAALLERHGVPALTAAEDATEWLRRAVASVTRKVRHPGNHKYAWTMQKRDRKHLPDSLPYPKFTRHLKEAS